MYAKLHGAAKHVHHAINLDSLIDLKDHCGVREGIIVCNCSINGIGILIPGSLVKPIYFDITFMVMNN